MRTLYPAISVTRKGSRFVVECGRERLDIPYDSTLDEEDNHYWAATAIAEQMGYKNLRGGVLNETKTVWVPSLRG
jgi:hypothetical protein